MANTKSAKKAIRVSGRKAIINLRSRRSFKEARKDVKKAIEAKDKKGATKLLPTAYKEIDKAAKRHIIHKSTAGRYKSSLSKAIAKLSK
ncbi:MAG: 30S ribosomal protein S20 [Candidatus Dojkabacteria bacterium]